MKSLADILRNALPHHADRESPSIAHGPEAESPYLLLAQKPGAPQPPAAAPNRREVLNYVGELADEYHLPRKLVHAVADAESSVNPEMPPHPNYLKRNGKIAHDKQGSPIIKSWDYGMMQVGSSDINKGLVKDAHGRLSKLARMLRRIGELTRARGCSIGSSLQAGRIGTRTRRYSRGPRTTSLFAV